MFVWNTFSGIKKITVKHLFNTIKDNETTHPSMQFEWQTQGNSDAGVDVAITNDGRKEFRSRAASGHEGRTCYIFAKLETLWGISTREVENRTLTVVIIKSATEKINTWTKDRAERSGCVSGGFVLPLKQILLLFYQQNYCFSMYICILICYCVCLSYLTQFLKGGDKVVITDNSQSTEHVYSLERQSQRIHTSEN